MRHVRQRRQEQVQGYDRQAAEQYQGQETRRRALCLSHLSILFPQGHDGALQTKRSAPG
jgi:hypothetical protein